MVDFRRVYRNFLNISVIQLIRMSVAHWHRYFPGIAILDVNSGISKMFLSQVCIYVQRFCVILQRQKKGKIVSVSFSHNEHNGLSAIVIL